MKNTKTKAIKSKRQRRLRPATCSATACIPKNKFGIFACHTKGKPFTKAEMRKIINGPIAAMEPKLQAELAKVVTVTRDEWPNNAISKSHEI